MRSSLVLLLLAGAFASCRTPESRPEPVRPVATASGSFVLAGDVARRHGLRVEREGDGRYLSLTRGSRRARFDVRSRVSYFDDRLVVLESTPETRGNDVGLPPDAVVAIASFFRDDAPVRPAATTEVRPTSPRVPRRDLHVALDAGHGGKDSGAVGAGGRLEKDVVLPLTLQIARALERDGVRVSLTRRDDRFIPLGERVAIGVRAGADVFVSIHANSASNARARGVEVYHGIRRDEGHDADKVAESLRLAQAIYKRLEPISPASDRGLKGNPRGLQVLKNNPRPAVLIEVGFLTNSSDLALLGDRAYLDRVAEAIAAGVRDYASR